jgi:hypothetical protein
MIDFINRSTAVGVFCERRDAENAVEDLRVVGFLDDRIGFLTRGEDAIVAEGVLANLYPELVVGTGGLVGPLVDLGISEAEAYFCDYQFRHQGTLIIVQAEARYYEARGILRCNNAVDIESHSTTSDVDLPHVSCR